jgi:eukaryotic-like serine/threonine-protein kinase
MSVSNHPNFSSGEAKQMIGRIFLGRYETQRLLGEGGMGKVFLARDLQLPRQVVVKVMHEHIAADRKFCDRFKRETEMTARFHHPYAVILHDASLNDPQGPCIIMEYIRGITLDELLIRNGRLSPVRVGRLLGQMCEVLYEAHRQGIVHRDLKPSNLMVVDHDSPYEKIKVMDFGLAKLVSPDPTLKKITESNMDFAVGTPGYICPELVRGEPADHRGDLYSVGVILYEMLSGRLPFSGGSTMDILLAHATEPPPFFSDIGISEWVPKGIEEVVRECLAKEAKDRPQSARDLAERYETALAHQEKLIEESLPANHPRAQFAGSANTPVPAPPVTPQRLPPVVDARAVINHLDAWMPEQIALVKLRGFVHDAGGELVESVPGKIKVLLDGTMYATTGKRALSWLGIAKPQMFEVELCLEKVDPTKSNQLHITVVMRVPGRNCNDDPMLHARCDKIFCDLRAYLMGQTGSSPGMGARSTE